MTSLFLIPLVYLFLKRGKSKNSPKSLPASTGLTFTCSSIQINNKQQIFSKIDSMIVEFAKNAKEEYNYLNVPDLFEFILKSLNPLCYTKMINRKLKHQEKLVISLLFIIIFNRLLLLVKDSEEYAKDFEHNVSKTILHVIGLTVNDKDDVDTVNEEFYKNGYKYP